MLVNRHTVQLDTQTFNDLCVFAFSLKVSLPKAIQILLKAKVNIEELVILGSG